jgi:lipopolysaccharide biosynthesis glycosyltransferase
MVPDIKIFVCHTPGRESMLPPSPYFVHVLGGAALANENPQELARDDTGDNISEKNESYCELTVQYWAWKNVDAEYYGFCHYRRYFSFGHSKIKTPDIYANIVSEFFNDIALDQINVNADIIKKIQENNFVLTVPFNVKNINSKNIYGHYKSSPSLHIKDLDILLETIRDISPGLENAANQYMQGYLLYPCNMFIMKREIFNRYCEWLFPVLKECEKRIDTNNYNKDEYRAIAHLAERCLGIFYIYLNKNQNITAAFFYRLFITRPDAGIRPCPKYKDQVTVATASNNQFVPYMAIMLQSLIENATSNNKYEIFVMHTEITIENQEKIKALTREYPYIFIKFYNMAMDVAMFKFKCSEYTNHITHETYYRSLVHKIFSNYGRVLYLDSDMIVKANVADIYNIDMGDNLLGACLDGDIIGQYCLSPDTKRYIERVLKIKNPFEYFQAGVQLINIQQFKKEFGDYELANKAAINNYRYVDQDVFNIACHGKVYFLDASWNVLVQHRWDRMAVIAKSPSYIYREYLNSRKNPKIIHYAGGQKPWLDPEMDFAPDFWNVARRSPFYETILVRLYNYKPPLAISKKQIRKIIFLLFPHGSRRRNFMRKIYYTVIK